ncbi:exosortase A [Sphingomonas sp.]|uniref:exosortase A n=1 Tax=Sphingomonas sp. TaxID=28214 RepID=UPI0035BBD57B
MTIAVPVSAFGSGVWRKHLGALALASAAILLLFYGDVTRLTGTWWTSTTFGHCLFVGPVVAWLVWQRRAELARLTPAAWASGLALVAAGGFGWLLGEAGSVTFARQFGLVLMLQGAVVTLLGPNVARGLLFPLAYTLFLVPFGEWLEVPLQAVTVAIVMPLLHLVGMPAASNGVLIHAGRYYFEVAEACSGAKFVIAMLAFGTLVANVGFTSWRRRTAFMAMALVVPVLANGVRAFATIWAADLTSVEAATGFDHIVYGWVFFAAVIAAVLALAWRWFDRAPDAPAFDPAALGMRFRATGLPLATMLVVAIAGLFPAWSAAVDARATTVPAHIVLREVPGWRRVSLDRRAAWQPYHPGADHVGIARYADGQGAVDLAVAVYGHQGEARELAAFGTGVLREEDRWVRVADLAPLAGGSAMRITVPGPVERVVVTWYRIGGITTADERRVKIETARARLLGLDQTAAAIHLSVVLAPGIDAEATIRRFLDTAGPVERLAGLR